MLAVCRGLVDKSLKEEYRSGISAKSLYDRYTSFGDDPSIVVLDGTDDRAIFSAWNYAKKRCTVICAEHVGGIRRRLKSADRRFRDAIGFAMAYHW